MSVWTHAGEVVVWGRMRCWTHANERQAIILDGFRLLLRCQQVAGAGGAIIGHQELRYCWKMRQRLPGSQAG